eukprot:TRINITY_DN1964_c0_g1_i1.p4 TRINITY_DN1964_c0_g1~~TRINITY_DN1964_c0_g1_i1.p4  ORF type:complete len:686 (+),score=116.33 TRINITY_DN1964_c0_g1_i1:4996-7053(+)
MDGLLPTIIEYDHALSIVIIRIIMDNLYVTEHKRRSSLDSVGKRAAVQKSSCIKYSAAEQYMYFTKLKAELALPAVVQDVTDNVYQKATQAVKDALLDVEFEILNKVELEADYLCISQGKSPPVSKGENVKSHMNGKELIESRIKQYRMEATAKLKREMEEKMRILDEKLKLLSMEKTVLPSPTKKSKKPLTEKERKQWKYEWESKRKEAEEFAKRMINFQNEVKRKTEEQLRQVEEKIRKEREEEERKEKERQELEEKQRKEEIRRKFEEAEAKRKERKEQAAKSLNDSGILHKKPYLYEKMTKEYKETVEMSELEKRKKTIAEKRNIYQPIRKAEFDSHSKQHEETVRKLLEERKKERVKTLKTNVEEYEGKMKKYKTSFADVAIRSSTEAKVKHQENLMHKQQKVAKMQEYAKAAQEEHAPIINPNKVQELKQVLEKNKRKPSCQRSTSSKKWEASPRKNAKKPGSIERKLVDHGEQVLLKRHETIAVKSRKSPKTTGDDLSSAKLNTTSENANRKIDYLAELRKNGIIRQPEKRVERNYEEVIQDQELSPQEKLARIKEQVDAMEKSARKKEALINPKKGGKGFLEAESEISDIYIQSIKAKLSLLNLQYYGLLLFPFRSVIHGLKQQLITIKINEHNVELGTGNHQKARFCTLFEGTSYLYQVQSIVKSQQAAGNQGNNS